MDIQRCKRFAGPVRATTRRASLSLLFAAAATGLIICDANAQSPEFQLQETTIAGIHAGIRSGQLSCEGLVRTYLARARAYNGVCTALVTADGAPVEAAFGSMNVSAPRVFPTDTVPVAALLPDLDSYEGRPLDLGRFEPSVSDPTVMQQFGMIAGIPNAGQVNALETLNIRGERSVTCKAECDAQPSSGPLPASCPAVCDAFRGQPDALERAAELDARFGRAPDLDKLPMYCTVLAVKNWYDVKDMRSTGGNDVAYAMDVPPEDSTIVARLRAKGAIILGVAGAGETSLRSNEPAEPALTIVGDSGNTRSTWGGEPCNPYDTQRTAGPSSGGSGAAVNANLVTCAICETTSGSCRLPANQNALSSLVTTRGLTSEHGTATATFINHRPGALCRTLEDSARLIDAMQKPDGSSYDSKDVFTAVPKSMTRDAPYASFIGVRDEGARPLAGMRIGIVREYMVKHTANDVAISDRVDAEIKAVLRDRLGAQIVESVDPLYPDDPSVPNMRYTFQDAFAEVLPLMVPEYFGQKRGDALEFAVPGYDVTTLDYLLDLSLGMAPLSEALNMRRILRGFDNTARSTYSMARYLRLRGDEKIRSWSDYATHSKWRSVERTVGTRNAAVRNVQHIAATAGIDRVKMQEAVRVLLLKVMYENDIDVFVHPSVTVPMWKIGIDREPISHDRNPAGPAITDLIGAPEVSIPAGYSDVVYDPEYVLTDDKRSYTLVTGSRRSTLRRPMPFSIIFWAGPGDEPTVLRVASAYEAATAYRVPPADFGPLAGESSAE